MRRNVTAVFILVFAAFVAYAGPLLPEKQDRYINDFAGVLAETDSRTMSEMLKAFERKSSVQVAVASLKSLAEFGFENDVDGFSAALFKYWGMDAANSGRAILMVLSYNDRKMKIESGGGFSGAHEDSMHAVMEKNILPFFRQGSYSRGIYEGLRAIIKRHEQEAAFNRVAPFAAAGAVVLLIAAVLFAMAGRVAKGAGRRIKQQDEAYGGGASGNW